MRLSDEGILYINNSALQSLSCSTKFLMRWQHGYTSQDDSVYLRGGGIGHKVIETLWKTDDPELAMAELAPYAQWCEENVPYDHPWHHDNLSRILTKYVSAHGRDAFDFEIDPALVEISGKVALSENIRFVFRPDAIVRQGDEYYLLDTKFTGNITPYWVSKYKLDSQFSGYIWAARQQLELPVVGAYINAVEVKKVPDSQKRCSEHGVAYEECGLEHVKMQVIGPYMRTESELKQWHRDAVHLSEKARELMLRFRDLKDIRKTRTQGKFFNGCAFCDFSDWCYYGRPVDRVGEMLKYEVYNPYGDLETE